MIVWLVAMLFGSHGHFVHSWNATSGTHLREACSAQASHLGFSAAGPIGGAPPCSR